MPAAPYSGRTQPGVIFFGGDAMTLTDKHISDEWLNKLIVAAEVCGFSMVFMSHVDKIMSCLLELKQRRAEDLARQDDGR